MNKEFDKLIRSSFFVDEWNEQCGCNTVSKEEIENNYNNYLDLYNKYDEFETGCLIIYTEDIDSLCSYFYKDKNSGTIESIHNLAPFSKAYVPLNPNKELYIYSNGVVRKWKSKYAEFLNNHYPPNAFNLIVFLLVFLVPCLILYLLDYKGIVSIGDIQYAFYLCYFFFLIYLGENGKRKRKKLYEKRKDYIKSYLQGKKDERV